MKNGDKSYTKDSNDNSKTRVIIVTMVNKQQ